MSRIVILGLPYSPNVGDGVIADCLRAGLLEAAPEAEVQCIDISGRQGFGEVTVKRRSLALAVLRALPRPLAQRLVMFRLGRLLDGFEPDWRQAAAGADLAIIGGGQIFSDADLNFCLKIERVARVLDASGCPVVVHAAGAARNWSPRGRALFRRLLECDLRAVGLRDETSIRNWRDQMGDDGPRPVLTRDPALIAAQVYKPGEVTQDSPFGLCVTDPAILSYHAEGGKTAISQSGTFAEIALALVARGHRVTLFCNGAVEDREALSATQTQPEIAAAMESGQIDIAPPPDTPAELAAIIARLRAIVAHRLHACILGYAFRRPIVGLGWDRKLESFFQSVGLEDNFLPANSLTQENVAHLLEAAVKSGIDPDRHAAVVAETRSAIRAILAAL
ncbi:polysaccharide pyruvyl transferase family protein [Marimonas lutisalis]|uniref:polysaccharide pyruvyl transferase family protein n=1 Tax=Marimonas lutisalis TaxID=2545756 RepID=UPI0013755864|nr:polysaccharide pyruvyl transferase family protein [Marimonas lutisalis]